MTFSRLLVLLCSTIIVISTIWAATSWWQHLVKISAINIMTYRDVTNDSLPVFAQFIFTQTLQLKEPILLTEITVPIFYPQNSEWLQIDLRQNNHLLQRWRLQPSQVNQITDTVLPFYSPISIKGSLELVFNGSHILYDDQNKAPRIFIETSDGNYPDGNYRIANNEKQGDIGLTMVALEPRGQQILQSFNKRPLALAAYALHKFLFLLLIGTFPIVIYRTFIQKDKNKATGKTKA